MKHLATIMLMTIALPLRAQPEPTDKHFWHSATTTAAADTIWAIWTDVAAWKNWDTGLRDAVMSEPFALGASGTIISLEGRKSRFTVVAFEPGKAYTFRTKLPLGSLYVKRFLEADGATVRFTHEVWFRGFTGGLFARAFGKRFR
ncbi:MAG: SRPBCC family protein, partial [Bacteroidota bacterium]